MDKFCVFRSLVAKARTHLRSVEKDVDVEQVEDVVEEAKEAKDPQEMLVSFHADGETNADLEAAAGSATRKVW